VKWKDAQLIDNYTGELVGKQVQVCFQVLNHFRVIFLLGHELMDGRGDLSLIGQLMLNEVFFDGLMIEICIVRHGFSNVGWQLIPCDSL